MISLVSLTSDRRSVIVMLRRARRVIFALLCLATSSVAPAGPVTADTTTVQIREVEVHVPGGRLTARLHRPAGLDFPPVAIVVRDPRHGEAPPLGPYTGVNIAVLEVDHRGTGGSTGDWRQRTVPQLATDMLAAMRRVQQEPDIDAAAVGFVGLNRGGWVALVASAMTDDAAFLVTVGTPFVPGIDQVLYEEDLSMRQRGFAEEDIRSDLERLGRRFRTASTVPQACRMILDPDLCSTLAFRPGRFVGRVDSPVLTVFSEDDRIVPVEVNLAALRERDVQGRFAILVRPGVARPGSVEVHRDVASWLTQALVANEGQAVAGSRSEPPRSVRTHSFYPMPSLFFNPETSWGGGASVTHTLGFGGGLLPQHPTVSELGLIITERRQVIASASTHHYTPGNRYLVSLAASHIHFPESFYGVGSDLPVTARESYVNQRSAGTVAARRRLGRGFFLGASLQAARHRVLNVDPEGMLALEGIPGSEGGMTVGLGVRASWDTRDHVFTAVRGSWIGLRIDHFAPAYGSDYTFSQANLDARYYYPLSASHRLAFQMTSTVSRGDVPFQMMPRMGGPFVMRGFVPARHRDRDLAVMQAEYRADVWGPAGVVAFAHVGGVADDLSRMDLGDVRAGFGAGLRLSLGRQDRLNFRGDYAFAGELRMLYLTMGEAF